LVLLAAIEAGNGALQPLAGLGCDRLNRWILDDAECRSWVHHGDMGAAFSFSIDDDVAGQ
jgi:hypothetical protein